MLIAGVNILSLKAADMSFSDDDKGKWYSDDDKGKWEEMLERVRSIDEKNEPQKKEFIEQFKNGSITEELFELVYKGLDVERDEALEYIKISNHTDEPIKIVTTSLPQRAFVINPHQIRVVKSTTGGASIDLFDKDNKQIKWDKKGKGMEFNIKKFFSVERENPFTKKK